MAVRPADIRFYYTGGATNSDPALSIGGAASSVEIVGGAPLFDDVTGYESLTGNVAYRCFAVKNIGTQSWLQVKVHVASNTVGDDTISIAVETPSGNLVQQLLKEDDEPIGLTFATPSSRDNGILCGSEGSVIGKLDPGKWIGIWVKREVPAGSRYQENNAFTISISGEAGV
jgi:hypothetical protein